MKIPMKEISWDDFTQIEMRVGTIKEAELFKEARKPAYKLLVDFGEEIGVKKSSAQITAHYSCEGLIGKQVVGVINFPVKQIGPMLSECLITGFYDNNGEVILCCPDKDVAPGSKLL